MGKWAFASGLVGLLATAPNVAAQTFCQAGPRPKAWVAVDRWAVESRDTTEAQQEQADAFKAEAKKRTDDPDLRLIFNRMITAYSQRASALGKQLGMHSKQVCYSIHGVEYSDPEGAGVIYSMDNVRYYGDSLVVDLDMFGAFSDEISFETVERGIATMAALPMLVERARELNAKEFLSYLRPSQLVFSDSTLNGEHERTDREAFSFMLEGILFALTPNLNTTINVASEALANRLGTMEMYRHHPELQQIPERFAAPIVAFGLQGIDYLLTHPLTLADLGDLAGAQHRIVESLLSRPK